MDPSRRRVWRVVGLLVVVAGLLTVVALAAGGKVPAGSARTRRPADEVMDAFVSLWLVMMAFAALLFVYLFFRRDVLREFALRRRKRRGWTAFVPAAIFFVGLAIAVRIAAGRNSHRGAQPLGPHSTLTAPGDTTRTGSQQYVPHFAWIPVIVVVGLGVSAAIAVWFAARARRPARELDPSTLAEALVDVLQESLDDLRAERDPRRAVIAAYARLERTLAAYGLPRHPAEAPFEYVERMLADLAVSSVSIRRLTALFERAKFSQHEVAPEMKDEAIDALEMVQFELEAAEIRAAEERAAALASARERAAR